MAFIPSHVRTRKGNTQNTTASEWLLNRERKGKEKQRNPQTQYKLSLMSCVNCGFSCHDCPYSLLGKGRNYVGISTDGSCPKMPHSR